MTKKVIYTKKAPEPIGPYSQAVLCGDLLFISVQIAIHPDSGTMVQDSLIQETHQVLRNIQAILQEAGLDMSNVVKTGIFLDNMQSFETVNSVYTEYFSESPPARETVGVAGLPKNARVEISVIATTNNTIKA